MDKSVIRTSFVCAVVGALTASVPASAQPRHHAAVAGVSYARGNAGSGYQPLVSDGPGTGFGFHRLPASIRVAAAAGRDRQSQALRDAVVTDALTNGNGNYGFGLRGDSVYGYGNRASYGVYSGADGYGSPYFAGYYGPGGGTDYGPFGNTYD